MLDILFGLFNKNKKEYDVYEQRMYTSRGGQTTINLFLSSSCSTDKLSFSPLTPKKFYNWSMIIT